MDKFDTKNLKKPAQIYVVTPELVNIPKDDLKALAPKYFVGVNRMEYDQEHKCSEGSDEVKIFCATVSGDEYWYLDGHMINFCPFCGIKLEAPSK